MSDAIKAGFLRRVLNTPLSDLLRGRATGRRHVPAANAAANAAVEAVALPPAARELIDRVVKRTRLWRSERADVAAELRAHFADGLAVGESADELVAAFGAERQAARLIRRAKVRNRPLVWHAARFGVRLTMFVIVVYTLLTLRFFLGRPVVSIDYVARLNAPIEQSPIDQRAWPLYERALNDIAGPDMTPDLMYSNLSYAPRLMDARPGSQRWTELTAWIDARQAPLELARKAAAKPGFGFVMVAHMTPEDSQSGKPLPLVQVLLPYLYPMRMLAEFLSADIRVARARGDADRLIHDLKPLCGMADHLREAPFLVCKMMATVIDYMALEAVDHTLSESPALLTDAALVRLAHRLADLDERTPLIDLAGERMFFYDLLQRLFTDDGLGDGRFTSEGFRALSLIQFQSGPVRGDGDALQALAIYAAGPVGLIGSRREQLEQYDRLMDIAEAQLRRPAREADLSAVTTRLMEIRNSPMERTKYLPILVMMPAAGGVRGWVDRLLGKRDGLTVAIALELHRRRKGSYPASLDELVPGLLPAIPADRITGGPIRYRLIDGKPVVYSVGVDRDDDGGRPALDPYGKPRDDAAAQWPHLDFARPAGKALNVGDAPADLPDGDWVLFPAQVSKDQE